VVLQQDARRDARVRADEELRTMLDSRMREADADLVSTNADLVCWQPQERPPMQTCSVSFRHTRRA
jgi:hypothetical protein